MVFPVAAATGGKLRFGGGTKVGQDEERRRYYRKQDGNADRSRHVAFTPMYEQCISTVKGKKPAPGYTLLIPSGKILSRVTAACQHRRAEFLHLCLQDLHP
jgi:hypothetical protein